MIVDDVEKHHQPAKMRFIDQRLEIVGPSIGAVRRIPQDAVIAPVAPAGEIRQRHQFQCGDSGCHEMIEPADHGAVGTFRCEGADMGFEHARFPATDVHASPWRAMGRWRDRLPRWGRKRHRAETRRPDREHRSRRRSGTCNARRPLRRRCRRKTSRLGRAAVDRVFPATDRHASPPAPTAETMCLPLSAWRRMCRSFMPNPQKPAPSGEARSSRFPRRSPRPSVGCRPCSTPAARSCIPASSAI